MDHGAGFGGEESLEIGPRTPGGEEQSQMRPRLIQRVPGIPAGEMRLSRLEKGGTHPQEVLPDPGFTPRRQTADGREDATVVLGGPDEVQDPERFGACAHTALGRGNRAAEGRL